MLLDQIFEGDVLFLGDVVDCKVLSLSSDHGGSLLENGFEIGLFEEEDVENACEATHDAGDILGLEDFVSGKFITRNIREAA